MSVSIVKIADVIMEIQNACPRIQTHSILVLLLVADNQGISMGDIGKKIGISQSAVSRNVGALGPGYRINGTISPGYGLVEASPSPWDHRSHLVYLTRKGKKVMGDMLAKCGVSIKCQ